MQQTLNIIHDRIHTRLTTLGNLNQYLYHSLMRFGNAEQLHEVLPCKASGGVTQQLDALEALDPHNSRAGASLHSVQQLQDWIEDMLAALGREGVKASRLQVTYMRIAAPTVSTTDTTLAQFEAQLSAVNLFDQMNEVYRNLRSMAERIAERLPNYKQAINGLQQAPMTMDYIVIETEAPANADPRELQIAIPCTETNLKEFLRMSYQDTIRVMELRYDSVQISFPVPEPSAEDLCQTCGKKMVMDPFNSEMVCQDCGTTYKLDGVVFEESQLYSQQSTASKHKSYKYNAHCEKWLNQIQAKENKVIPPEVVNAVYAVAKRDYTRGGMVRTMRKMRCLEVRRWLKQLGLTTYNNNAALIRKLVTALNGEVVTPPQLTMEETYDILYDFSRAMDLYETLDREKDALAEMGKTKVGNKPYYPYGLMKILINRLPAGQRLNELLECIHLQTDATLKKHDKFWRVICGRIPDFKYEPTNRTALTCML